MKCLTCLYYVSETCIEELVDVSLSQKMLDDLDKLGFDGYCAELDVYIGEECCCSSYVRMGDD